MKRLLATIVICCAFLSARAEMLVGVQLYDMYKVEAVSVMTSEEFRELRGFLAEEKRVFNKAYAAVRQEWTKQYTEARRNGDKDFPKFPTKQFIWPRTCKAKNFATREAADEWLAKQKERVNAWMAAEAGARKEAEKAAKGAITRGYASRDDKKARRHADRDQMEAAVKEKLGEFVELKMAELLKYNRPVPRHFIIDPMQGTSEAKTIGKKVERQEAAWKKYLENKAKAEAASAESES